MPNPFKHRASEYQGNEFEFLATLTPSLFRMTLDEYKDPEDLLTRVVVFSAPRVRVRPRFLASSSSRHFLDFSINNAVVRTSNMKSCSNSRLSEDLYRTNVFLFAVREFRLSVTTET